MNFGTHTNQSIVFKNIFKKMHKIIRVHISDPERYCMIVSLIKGM